MEKPSLSKIKYDLRKSLEAKLIEGKMSMLSRSLLNILVTVWAGALYMVYNYLDWIAKQVFPSTATEEKFLKRWADIYGVDKRLSTLAYGSVLFTGDHLAEIPENTQLQSEAGNFYRTEALGVIDGEDAEVIVFSEEPGEEYNLDSGVLSLISSLTGIDTESEIVEPISGGTDDETLDEWRSRIRDRLKNPPQGGSASDYRQWALSVEGISHVKIVPHYAGLGTVGVRVLSETLQSGPFTDEVIRDAVVDYVEPRKPVTGEVFVFTPDPQHVSLTIRIQPNIQSVRDAVEQQVKDEIRRVRTLARDGLYVSRLKTAIGSAHGIQDFILEEINGEAPTNTSYFIHTAPVFDAISFYTL